MRERRPVFVGSGEVPIWHQFYWTNSTGSILLDQFYWTNSTGPILLDQFYWTNLAPISTGPILLAYDFFLNFWIRLSALSICLMDRLNFRLGLIHHWRIPPKIANRPIMANR